MKKIFAVFSVLALAAAVQSAVIWSDDFESAAVGSAPADSAWNNTGGLTVRDEVTDTPFGTSSQYLESIGNAGGWYYAELTKTVAGVSSIVFDFKTMSNFDSEWIRFEFLGDAGETMTRQDFNGGGAELSAYLSVDTVHQVSFVLNTTDSELTDYEGTQDLAANSIAVWIDGGHSYDETLNAGDWNQLETFGIWLNGGGDTDSGAMYDNITIYDTTVVPEPATVGMLGLGALITLVVRRMRG